jgi:hypothetical protein
MMPKLCQPMKIKARPASKVKDFRWLLRQYIVMNPIDMPVDYLEPTACGVMILGKVFLKHPLAEFGVVPRNIVRLLPWNRRRLTTDYVSKFHDRISFGV